MKTSIQERTSKATSKRPWALYRVTAKYDGRVFTATAIDRRKARHDLFAQIATYDNRRSVTGKGE